MKSILHALISIGFLILIVSGNTINRNERSVDIDNQNNQQIYESASFRDAGFDEKLPERLLPSQAQRNTSRKLLSWSMFFKYTLHGPLEKHHHSNHSGSGSGSSGGSSSGSGRGGGGRSGGSGDRNGGSSGGNSGGNSGGGFWERFRNRMKVRSGVTDTTYDDDRDVQTSSVLSPANSTPMQKTMYVVAIGAVGAAVGALAFARKQKTRLNPLKGSVLANRVNRFPRLGKKRADVSKRAKHPTETIVVGPDEANHYVFIQEIAPIQIV